MTPTKNGTHSSNLLGKPTRTIVLGYYDGPTDGVIQFGEQGPVFHFSMPDEEQQLASEAKTRVFLLQPMPGDSIERITALLEPFVASKWPMWCPKWKFPSPQIESEIDSRMDTILSEAGEAEWKLTTASNNTFDVYQADRIATTHESRR